MLQKSALKDHYINNKNSHCFTFYENHKSIYPLLKNKTDCFAYSNFFVIFCIFSTFQFFWNMCFHAPISRISDVHNLFQQQWSLWTIVHPESIHKASLFHILLCYSLIPKLIHFRIFLKILPLPALHCTVNVRDGSAQFELLYTFVHICHCCIFYFFCTVHWADLS